MPPLSIYGSRPLSLSLVDLLCLTHFTHFACDLTDFVNSNPKMMHKIVKLNMIPAKQPLVFVLMLACREIRGTWQKPNICNFQICGKGPSSLGPLQFFVGKNLNWDLGIRSKNQIKIVQISRHEAFIKIYFNNILHFMRFDDRYLLPNWKEQNLHDLNCCFFILCMYVLPKWLLCPTNLVCWSSQIPKISWSSTTRPKMAVTPPPCHEFTKSCKNSSHLQDGILDGWAADIPFTLLRSRCYFRVPNLYLGHCTISWYHHYTCSNNLKIGSLEKWH